MGKRKRGHGEGSIFRRPDGRWCASVTVGYDAQGRQKKRYVYGRTRQEAAEKLARLLHERQQGLLADPTRETVAQFLERWLRDVVAPSVRPKTLEAYTVAVRAHLIPGLGRIRLAALTPAHITAFYAQKLREGLAPKYVLNIGAVLHRALEVAVKWNLIPRNPAKLAERPKTSSPGLQFLTPEQVWRLLEAGREHRLHALFVLMATAGLRLGEALGLKWEDVNLDEGYAVIRHQLQWAGKPQRPALVPPKSARSRRRVELMPMAVEALRQHRRRQAEERLRAGEAWQDWGLVFCTELGTPLHPSNVRNRAFYPLLKKAGLPKVRIHDLRHFAASAMIQAGVSPRVVMEQLGHSQIAVTMNLYGHIWPAALKEAAAKTQEFLLAARSRRA